MVRVFLLIFQDPAACCLAVGLRPEYLPADGQGLMTAWSTGSPVLKPEGGEGQVIAGWVAQTPQLPQTPKSFHTNPLLMFQTSLKHLKPRRIMCKETDLSGETIHFSRPLQLLGIEWRAMDIQRWGSLESVVPDVAGHVVLFWRFLPWTWPGKGWTGTMKVEGHWMAPVILKGFYFSKAFEG